MCLLSPPLFCVCLETVAGVSRREKEMQVIQIRNEEVGVSLEVQW